MGENRKVTELTVEVTLDKRSAAGFMQTAGGLLPVLQSLKAATEEAFSVKGFKNYTETAKRYGSELAGQLLYLQLSLGKLKAAFMDALAPILSLLVPVVNGIIRVLTRLVSFIGQVLRALFGGVSGQSAAAKNQIQSLGDTVTSTSRAVKKALAKFDQVERLEFARGSGTAVQTQNVVVSGSVEDTLSPQVQRVVDKIRKLIAPLKRIDLTPLREAFERLKQTLAPLKQAILDGLEWVWFNILVPMAQWTVEKALPVFLDYLGGALSTLGTVLEALKPVAVWFWDEFLKPAGQWAGEKLLAGMKSTIGDMATLRQWLVENKGQLAEMIVKWLGLKDTVQGVWGKVKEVLGNFGWFQDTVVQPVQTGFKGLINSVITFLNSLIGGIGKGINGCIDALNQLSVTIPRWVPVYGGKRFGFDIENVGLPKIPYLAQGAVIPPNRRFLAVLGDQKQGTNIEAPLKTIEQALANVMAARGENNVTIRFTGELAQLGRVLRPVIDREQQRRGGSLAAGGVY